MRISDWSSDVCSSDLQAHHGIGEQVDADGLLHRNLADPEFRGNIRERREHGIDRERTKHRQRTQQGRKRSEEHTSELQSLMRISYAVFCLKKKTKTNNQNNKTSHKYDKAIQTINTDTKRQQY